MIFRGNHGGVSAQDHYQRKKDPKSFRDIDDVKEAAAYREDASSADDTDDVDVYVSGQVYDADTYATSIAAYGIHWQAKHECTERCERQPVCCRKGRGRLLDGPKQTRYRAILVGLLEILENAEALDIDRLTLVYDASNAKDKYIKYVVGYIKHTDGCKVARANACQAILRHYNIILPTAEEITLSIDSGETRDKNGNAISSWYTVSRGGGSESAHAEYEKSTVHFAQLMAFAEILKASLTKRLNVTIRVEGCNKNNNYIHNVNQLIGTWEGRGWRKVDGTELEYVDDLKEILELKRKMRLLNLNVFV
ncbi:hypothetical protein THASP1DRAFT_24138, partial [Thamnocephalis sphaerospora]